MATISTFNVALSASVAGFIANIGRAHRRWDSFARSVQRHSRTMPKAIREATSASLALGRQVARAAAVGGAALATMGAVGVKLAAQYEQTRIAFATMLGSMEEADHFLRSLERRARKTSFSFQQLQDMARGFLAFGFSRAEIERMIDPIAGFAAAMGGGEETIDRVVRALGQIRTNMRLAAEEMNQLTEAGVPAWELVAEHIGVSTAQLRELVRKGAVPAQVAIEAIVEGLEKRFAGSLAAQANTLLGQWEQLKDGLTTISRGMGQDIIRILGLTQAIRSLNEAIGRFADLVSQHGFLNALRIAVPPWLPPLIVSVAGAITGALVPAIVAFLLPALRKLRTAILATGMSLRTWAIGGAAVAVVVYLIARYWNQLPSIARRVWGAVSAAVLYAASLIVRGVGLIISVVSWLIPSLRGAAATVIGWADSLKAAAQAAWASARSAQAAAAGVGRLREMERVTNAISNSTQGMADAAQKAADSQNKLADGVKKAADSAANNIQSFDEVHQIQEELADSGAGGGGLDIPSIDVPQIATPALPAAGGLGGGELGGGILDSLAGAVQRMQTLWQTAVTTITGWWENLKQKALETFPWLQTVINGVNTAIAWIQQNWPTIGPIVEKIASIIAVLFVPALIQAGLRAMAMGAQVLAGWLMAGLGATVALARTIVASTLIIGRFILMGVQATINAAKVAVAWAMQGWAAMAAVARVIVAAGIVVAQWVLMGIQATVNAIRMAAAWFIALGPVAWVIGIVVGLAALIIWKWDEIKQWTINAWNTASNYVGQVWDRIKNWASQKWQGITTTIGNWLNTARQWVSERWDAIKTRVGEIWDRIKAWAGEKWEGIVSTVSGWASTAKEKLTTTWETIKEKLGSLWEKIEGTASNVWDRIKNTIRNAVNSVIDFINRFIRGWNNIKLSVPSVNLPFVGQVGGWTISFPKIPEIPYLAKGGIVTDPTLAVVGERGPEAVLPLSGPAGSSLISAIRDAVAEGTFEGITLAERTERATDTGMPQELVFKIDGRTVARAILPYIISEGQRQGLRLVVQ